MKNERSTSYSTKLWHMLNFSHMNVKRQGQGHKVKNLGINKKVSS